MNRSMKNILTSLIFTLSLLPLLPRSSLFALQGPEPFGWGNGGWFSSLEIDKSNPNILYAASDMGGVFRSDDAGNHWTDLSVNFTGTPVWNLTFSPDGNTLYAQTQMALLKSTDQGNSWTSLTVHHENEISSGKPFVTRFHGAEIDGNRRTRTVVIDPANQNIIYLAGERGKDNHDQISSLNYLYKSTNGGQTWQELSAISDITNSLVLDANNRSILYASGPDGVRKSTDGGLTWVAKNTGISNLDTLDMRADNQNDTLYLLTKSGFYKSTDKAERWLLYNGTGGYTIPYPDRSYGVILTDETDSNHIFVALQSYIYETKDGALHWNNLFLNSMVNSADPDYAYAWDCAFLHCGGPTTDLTYNKTNNLLYGAGDTGIGMRDLNNPNSTWIIKHRGLYVAVTNALAFFSKDEIYAGGADTVLMKTINGGQTWRQITGKDSWAFTPNFWVWSIGLKKTDPRKIYICNENSARTSSAAAALYQSVNDGDTWENITSRLPNSSGSTKCSQVLVDKNNENIVYVLLDNKGLYRSTDNAATFTRITNSIPSVDQMIFTSASFVIDPVSPNIFYLAPRNGAKVYKSTDSGTSWTLIYQYDDNNPGGIAILQDSYHSIYLSMQHRLQRSRDQGATWQTVMNLDQLASSPWNWHYYFSIPVYNPLNNTTYVQITPWNHDPQNLSPAGIYASTDFGNTWERKYSLAHPGGNQLYLSNENDYLYVPSESGLWKYEIAAAAPSPFVATASATPTSGQAPLTVNFSGSASGGTSPYSYSWTFGDSGSSTAQNPSHTYSSAGTYTAALTVTDSASTTARGSVTITVTSTTSLLTANASASPTSGQAPLTVRFTGSASGGTSPYSYRWTFGDSGSSTAQSPSHTYSSASSYTATLTVTDSKSATSTKSLTVTATNSSSQLAAIASANPTLGLAPLNVNFTGNAAGGALPYSYSWNFGDGSTSSAQNPSHTYSTNGDYAIILTVTDSASATANATVNITVGSATAANLILAAQTGAPAPGQGGTTDPSPGNHSFSIGSTVSVRSVPNTDYRFSKWTGDITEAAAFNSATTLTMDNNKSLSATFCTKCADVNGDLKITPADAQLAFDIYLGKIANPTWCELENADVKCDGTKLAPKITPADAQTIFNKYLKKGNFSSDCSGNSRLAAVSTQTAGFINANLSIDNMAFTPNLDILIPVIIESPFEIKSFGFDLTFPSNILTFIRLESTELTNGYDQLGANVMPYQQINQELANAEPAETRVLRIGGYKTNPDQSPSLGVLVTLVFRWTGEFIDSNATSIIATYDDLQNASVINRMISQQNNSQIRERKRAVRNVEKKSPRKGKRYDF